MCSTCFPRSSLPADASLPSTGSSGASSPCFDGTIKALRRPAAIPPHFVSFVWRYLGCTRCFAPWQTSAPPRPGVGDPVSPAGNSPRSEQGSPKFLGNLMSVCTCSYPTPAGLLAPDHCSAAAWPLNAQVQRLPRLGLSTLNSMAFGLAAGTVRSMVGFAVRITPTPRKTRFQLLVKLYWTGFPPARFR